MPILMPSAIPDFDLPTFHFKKQKSGFPRICDNKIRFVKLPGIAASESQSLFENYLVARLSEAFEGKEAKKWGWKRS